MKSKIVMLALAISFVSFGQRVAFIETEYILGKMPAYAAAQSNLEKISADYQQEIDGKMKDLDKMYKKMQAELPLYSDQIRQEKIAAIDKLEQEIATYQKQRFGPNGDVYKKRQELMQPLLDKIFDEVQKIAQAKSFDLVFDKSNGNTIVYNNSKLNISDDVLKAMGY